MTSITIDGQRIIWIASYPRSGNTFLRTILWHCFGLRSASRYARDLDGNRSLEQYIGHIEDAPDGKIRFPPGTMPLMKTHELARDTNRAIYVVRDGRAAAVSFYQFVEKRLPLETMLEGRLRFGAWGDHLRSWHPWDRPDTLLLRYEDLRHDLPPVLEKIAVFLERPILGQSIPDRNTIAGVGGRFVRPHSDWRTELSGALLERFNQANRELLERFGYLQPPATPHR